MFLAILLEFCTSFKIKNTLDGKNTYFLLEIMWLAIKISDEHVLSTTLMFLELIS